ncbi:hypothetical protein DRQ25_14500 [Candidatus Fermentibacteria bacterium]|nr:MAG: hypothetical protein DRQ25_14500 [Candidatus Fermentibacteria bacterium]
MNAYDTAHQQRMEHEQRIMQDRYRGMTAQQPFGGNVLLGQLNQRPAKKKDVSDNLLLLLEDV